MMASRLFLVLIMGYNLTPNLGFGSRHDKEKLNLAEIYTLSILKFHS